VTVRWSEPHWGTVISLEVPDGVPGSIFVELHDWFVRVDELFSTWRDDSEVRRIADGRLPADDASPEVKDVLATCAALRAITDGAFDIEVGAHPSVPPGPGRADLDPSGYVKGWAMDRVAERLVSAGVTEFTAAAGGDVVVRSSHGGDGHGGDGHWRVGIQHPWERDRLAAVVHLDSGAVATSGRYERGDHVVDPRTGRPATGLMSVTVVGDELGTADAFATAAMAMGADGIAWLAARSDVEAMAITDERRMLFTTGFEDLIA
jgi:thiamine biosynthesis lipoprotein